MRPARSRHLPRAILALGGVAGLLAPGAARADDVVRITNGIPEVQPLIRDVLIRRIENGQLFYRERGGGERSVELSRVFNIRTTGDAVFNQADNAFVTSDWEKAVDGYQKVLRGTEPWKLQWAAPRLLVAADRADRFEAALAAYIATARLDPAAAARSKPRLPARPSKFLDDAAKALDAAATSARGDAERQALLSWLVEVEQARGDAGAIDAAVRRLADAVGPAPRASAAANGTTPTGVTPTAPSPAVPAPPEPGAVPVLPPNEAAAQAAAAMAVGADARLTQARAALAAGRYDDVVAAIDSARPMLLRSDQQAEALALVARARSAAADASGDAGARRDAALAWLRVVAHFNADPAAAGLVTEAMLDAARQQAAAGDVAAARALYEQLVAERPGTPAAQQAADRLDKLSRPGA